MNLQTINRGRRIVATLAVTHVVLAIVVVALAIGLGRNDQLGRLIFKLIATCASAYGLWTGSRWWIWLYVLGLSAVAFISFGVMLKHPHMFVPSIMIPIALFCMWGAYSLGFSPAVRAFHALQRGDISRSELIAMELQSTAVLADGEEELRASLRNDGIAHNALDISVFDEPDPDLPVTCGVCGTANSDGVAYCRNCGDRIS